MDKKNTLLIHIGTPKTGTTALQAFLYNNREVLEKYNWCYPDFKKIFPQYKIADPMSTKNGDVLLEKKVKYEYNVESDQWKNIWGAIRGFLKENNVIISEEVLYTLNLTNLLTDILNEYDNVKVILYLRRQDYYFESQWKHLVRTNSCCTSDIQEFDWKRDKYNYYKQLKELEDVIGKERIIVRVYEREQFEGEWKNIASDFLKCIEVCDLSGFQDIGRENENLNGYALEIKRMFNKYIEKVNYKRAEFNDFCFYCLRNCIANEAENTGYLSSDERKEILNFYESGNINIAKKYLDREDGMLFYDTNIDIPQFKSEAESLLEKAVSFFGKLIVEQQNRIANIYANAGLDGEQGINKLLIEMNCKNKKLVLFGAGERCRYLLKMTSIKPHYIIDNDKNKKGANIDGIKIIHPDNIEAWEEYVVIITCRDSEKVQKQLNGYGLKHGCNYILMSDYFV